MAKFPSEVDSVLKSLKDVPCNPKGVHGSELMVLDAYTLLLQENPTSSALFNMGYFAIYVRKPVRSLAWI